MVFLNNVIVFCGKKRYSSHIALLFLVLDHWMEKSDLVWHASRC
jgi:hypothetical protein